MRTQSILRMLCVLLFYPWLTEKESTQENVGMAVARRILLLIEHDDTFVDELSTGEASSGADGHLSLAVPDRPFGK